MFGKEKIEKSYLGGLITGGIIGVVTGILMAPKSGKEFRKDISEKTDELLNDTDKILKIAKEKAADIISDATEKAEKLIKDAGKKVETIMKCTDELLIQGKDKFQESLHKVKDNVSYSTAFRNRNIN